jgi:hypothetical protein
MAIIKDITVFFPFFLFSLLNLPAPGAPANMVAADLPDNLRFFSERASQCSVTHRKSKRGIPFPPSVDGSAFAKSGIIAIIRAFGVMWRVSEAPSP